MFEGLKQAKRSLCLVYEVPFLWMPMAVEQSSWDILEKTNAGTFRPLHILHGMVAVSNLEHE